ncbi:hypothetical protein NQ317_014638, partial [Molorchus minor]
MPRFRDGGVILCTLMNNGSKCKSRLIATRQQQLNYLVTAVGDPQYPLFWAIDDFRLCSTEEYRILELPNSKSNCQLVENGDVVDTNSAGLLTVDTGCPETTFGTHWHTCDIFGKETHIVMASNTVSFLIRSTAFVPQVITQNIAINYVPMVNMVTDAKSHVVTARKLVIPRMERVKNARSFILEQIVISSCRILRVSSKNYR